MAPYSRLVASVGQRELIRGASIPWDRGKARRIRPYLPAGHRILDVGSGKGGISRLLRRWGYDTVPLDVSDYSNFDDVRPILYDGRRLPFPDDSFGVVLLITVLHHIPDPDVILAEAARVSRRRIIVLEDTYYAIRKRRLLQLMDSIVNCEFRGHPHTNRTRREWRNAFARLGLLVVAESTERALGYFDQTLFVCEVTPAG